MATSSEGGADAISSGGGGAGGKFRKSVFRRAQRPSTPYDRPLTAQRGISNASNVSDNNNSLFVKLVLDPASKLISSGAHRFFSSVFRKRLPPSQAPEVLSDSSDKLYLAVHNSGEQKSRGVDNGQPSHSSASDGISELELLLRQKTFSRSEIDHLTRLLQSRAAIELSPVVDPHISEEMASGFGRNKQFSNSPLEENIKAGDVSHGVTPNSRVIEDDVASPAELAKAYMDARSSKISPMHSQIGREDTRFLGNAPFSSKLPSMSMTMRTPVSLNAPENGYITPKSRGRSAIYNMARTPYSRIHPLPVNKGIGLTNNGYGEPSMSSSSHSLVDHNENFEAKPTALKRRSSVLDDDIRSVGPIRRIRQKHNLIGSGIPVTARGAESVSDYVMAPSKQKLPLTVEPKRVLNLSQEKEDDSVPHSSYSHVPSRSSEMAARILQHLEKLTPKEKSSDSKLVTGREKSPFRLTPSMLRGQALRSMEDVDPLKLLQSIQDDHKLEDRPTTTATLPAAQDSSFKKLGKLEERCPKKYGGISDVLYPVMKNDFVVSLKAPDPSNGTSEPVVQIGIAQPPHTKSSFRMSAQEDLLELDDDENCYGSPPKPSTEGRGQTEATLVGNKLSLTEESKLVKATIQPNAIPLVLTKRSGSSGPLMIEEGSGDIALSSKKVNAAIQSEVHSASSLNKQNKTNDSLPLLSSSSKTVDNATPLPSESSSENPEPKSENRVSLVNIVSAAVGSRMKIPESDRSDQGDHLNPLKIGDANGKYHTLPSAALNGVNGPHVSRPPVVSFTTTFPYDSNQTSTASSSFFTPTNNTSIFGLTSSSTNTSSSTGITSFGSTGISTSTTFSGNPFGSNVAPPILGGPVSKFGTLFSSTVMSEASSAISEVAELKAKAEKEPNFGSSNATHSSIVSFAAASAGNSSSALGTSVSYSTANNIEGSPFGSINKSLVTGVGTGSHSSFQFGSLVSLPLVNMSNSTSLGTSPNSQFNSNQNFGFSSSASSLETSAVNSGGGPNTNVSKFGVSSVFSDGNVVSSSAGAAPTPGIFSFGLGLGSSTSALAAVSSNGVTSSVFKSGGSSAATSITNTARSSSSGTSGIFNFSASPSASSSAINSNSSNSSVSNIFGFTSPSPSTGFSFGASSSIFAPTSLNQPMFGNKPSSIETSPGNGDQMNADDGMAEDPVQSSTPSIPVFGLPAIAPSPHGFMFGSTVPSQANPFQFSVQQNQIPTQNLSPFQASGSLEFNAGGSFSLGSSGTDKSNRKFVKINRNKNRKK